MISRSAFTHFGNGLVPEYREMEKGAVFNHYGDQEKLDDLIIYLINIGIMIKAMINIDHT